MKLTYKATAGSHNKKRGKKVNLISKANFHTRKLHFPPHATKCHFLMCTRELCSAALRGRLDALCWAPGNAARTAYGHLNVNNFN